MLRSHDAIHVHYNRFEKGRGQPGAVNLKGPDVLHEPIWIKSDPGGDLHICGIFYGTRVVLVVGTVIILVQVAT